MTARFTSRTAAAFRSAASTLRLTAHFLNLLLGHAPFAMPQLVRTRRQFSPFYFVYFICIPICLFILVHWTDSEYCRSHWRVRSVSDPAVELRIAGRVQWPDSCSVQCGHRSRRLQLLFTPWSMRVRLTDHPEHNNSVSIPFIYDQIFIEDLSLSSLSAFTSLAGIGTCHGFKWTERA